MCTLVIRSACAGSSDSCVNKNYLEVKVLSSSGLCLKWTFRSDLDSLPLCKQLCFARYQQTIRLLQSGNSIWTAFLAWLLRRWSLKGFLTYKPKLWGQGTIWYVNVTKQGYGGVELPPRELWGCFSFRPRSFWEFIKKKGRVRHIGEKHPQKQYFCLFPIFPFFFYKVMYKSFRYVMKPFEHLITIL